LPPYLNDTITGKKQAAAALSHQLKTFHKVAMLRR